MIILESAKSAFEFYLDGVLVPRNTVVQADPEAGWIVLFAPKDGEPTTHTRRRGCVEAVDVYTGKVRRPVWL